MDFEREEADIFIGCSWFSIEVCQPPKSKVTYFQVHRTNFAPLATNPRNRCQAIAENTYFRFPLREASLGRTHHLEVLERQYLLTNAAAHFTASCPHEPYWLWCTLPLKAPLRGRNFPLA